MSKKPITTVAHETAPEYGSEKAGESGDMEKGEPVVGDDPYRVGDVIHQANPLKRNLHSRHMQMIAIGLLAIKLL
jgi:amino acid permease